MNIKRCSITEQLRDLWRTMFYVSIIIVAIVIAFLLGRSDAAQGLLIGSITGMCVHWLMSAKASTKVNNENVAYVKNWLTNNGYVKTDIYNVYIPNINRFLRFNSQNVIFSLDDGSQTTIISPYFVLKRLEKAKKLK